MIQHADELLTRLRAIHESIRARVIASCEQQAIEQLSAVVAQQAGDTIFALDRISEEVLVEEFTALGRERSFVLIAEGLGADGMRLFPAGITAEEAELRIIIDPIDGTRGIVYQKRPAWILTGVAPNRGARTSLADIELAVQTEIPLLKQHLCDCFWTIAGRGVGGERLNRLSGEREPLQPHPSRARTIAHGFGNLARFVPGGRAEMAAIDDALVAVLLGPVQAGEAQCFEDQYICTGGQLAELLSGHDRWQADLRALADERARKTGRALGLNCHPYDLCTELIAREAGLSVTDVLGGRLAAPLDVETGISWLGCANQYIYDQVAPVLRDLLRQHGFIETASTPAARPQAVERVP
ncbi:MAG TPA: inositol monophosphatase [Ktedonobacteraceae bacterium]|nr:inositol monophosphatase [Ktedonobacteraceae bacterium]